LPMPSGRKPLSQLPSESGRIYGHPLPR
jgi:hypothetical protein